jgi:hypothetical protein
MEKSKCVGLYLSGFTVCIYPEIDPHFLSMGRVRSKLDAGNFPGLIIRQPNFGKRWAIVHINMPATDPAGRHRIKRKFLCGRIEFAQYVLV